MCPDRLRRQSTVTDNTMPMRHAQISTTMNVYGNALMESKREANTKVVRMVLKNSAGFYGVEDSEAAMAHPS
ncbi:MAG: hypothetical protein DMG61_00335 [Acidobacteria bacterium]|nr:MAG: hypothetical protein DMG61_00335 [Acidobacteriota bacterium]